MFHKIDELNLEFQDFKREYGEEWRVFIICYYCEDRLDDWYTLVKEGKTEYVPLKWTRQKRKEAKLARSRKSEKEASMRLSPAANDE